MGFFARLFLALAVMLMPLGMAPVGASVSDRSVMTEMPMAHCPGKTPAHDMKGGIQECAMACAAALPAGESRLIEPPPVVGDPVRPRAAEPLRGLHPETAVPPPRRS